MSDIFQVASSNLSLRLLDDARKNPSSQVRVAVLYLIRQGSVGIITYHTEYGDNEGLNMVRETMRDLSPLLRPGEKMLVAEHDFPVVLPSHYPVNSADS